MGRIAKHLLLLPLLLSGLAFNGPAHADPSELCRQETERTERLQNIPSHLLTAISLAETGRWNPAKGENYAWPWTVTSGGEGRYFPTKQAAMAEVDSLKAKGITNIDVGCMQINLFHHGSNFASVAHAFDPAANVAYAADFLTRLFRETGSWTQAATYYHSRTPEFARRYHAKVTRLWDETRRKGEDGPAAGLAEPYRPVELASRERMAELNNSFRERRAGISTTAVLDRPWAEAEVRTTLTQADPAQAAAQRVLRQRETDRALNAKAVRGGLQNDRFAERRRSQLRAWREGAAYAP